MQIPIRLSNFLKINKPNNEVYSVGLCALLLRETLQSYGAKIWVEERRGGGARFVVDLGMQQELQD